MTQQTFSFFLVRPHWTYFYLFLLFLNFVIGKETVVMRDPAWFKICTKDDVLEIANDVCHHGVWLNSSEPLGCVCLNGIWVLSAGYCDSEALIVVGKGHCFDISKEVRNIKLLGAEKDAFYPAVYSAPSSMDVFTEVTDDTLSSLIDTDLTSLIGINPSRSVQRADELLCLKAVKKPGKPLYIYNNGHRMPNQWRFKDGDCNFAEDFHHKVGFGEMYTGKEVISEGKAQGICSIEKCKAKSSEGWGRSLGPGDTDNSNIPKLTADGKLHFGRSAVSNAKTVSAPFTVQQGSADEEKSKCLQSRADITIGPEQYEIETKEQTIRMLKNHLKPALLHMPIDQPSTSDMFYFDMVVRVALRTCPGGILTAFMPNMITGFTRMFKRLLYETEGLFPHKESTDNDQFVRINSTLHECYDSSENLEIDTIKDPDTQCSIPTGNITFFHPFITDHPKINANISILPDFLKTDMSVHDLAIEMSWKAMQIGAYRCALHFTDTADYSFMMEKLQSYFNPQIIKRWYNNHNALKVYTYMFQRINLTDFAQDIDECLAGAKTFSPIKDWMLRPKVPMSENDLSQARPKRSPSNEMEVLWDGKGICFREFMDPITKLTKMPFVGCPVNQLKTLGEHSLF